MTSDNTKVYLEIVKQIRAIIDEDGLVPGDKIPSERELTSRLKAGRSSIREALRALELLGLIETRRGEGTYIKDFTDHNLVYLLGSFILQGNKKKTDLLETKSIIERDCIKLACERITDEQLESLEEKIRDSLVSESEITEMIVKASNNSLLLRIWLEINEYFRFYNQGHSNVNSLETWLELLDAIKKKDVSKALQAYEKIIAYDI